MNRNRIEEVFQDVLDHPVEEREAALYALCGDDAALRGQVQDLLRADADAKSLAAPRIADPAGEQTVSAPISIGEKAGDVIGRYKLLQRIGEGGFGVVFTADQREPVRRKVALKIIKAGMDTREVLARFEAERQALALMDHPNVAKVFDAGATETGRPYFVMEHVAGVPIHEYCDAAKLTIRRRLELFLDVCQAVQHAHHKGIVHRDLKPTNILVTLQDGAAVPKVIDFGVAKATIGRLTEHTLFTETGRLIGTPEYMAPEQAGTSGLDVDTRADIYSLGAILYELLTGTLPFDAKTLRSAGFDGMAKIIRELEPPKPSTRLSTIATEAVNRKNGQTPDRIAKHHGADFRSLQRELRGDLDWITLKALEKDRARRYETANSMANDVRRFLSGEPVLAAPPSTTYRLRKFVRKHRVGVLAGGTIVVALVLGIIGTSVGLRWALRERDRAVVAEREQSRERELAQSARDAEAAARAKADVATARALEEAENAKAVSGFFESMFTSVDPIGLGRVAPGSALGASRADDNFYRWVGSPIASGQEITVLELLHRAVPTLEKAFSGRPAMEAAVRQTIGRTLFGLGLPWEADSQLDKAVEAWKKVRRPDHPDTLVAMTERAEEMLTNFNLVSQAAGLLDGAAAGLERAVGPEDRRTLRAKMLLAYALSRDQAGSEKTVQLAAEVAQTFERAFGPDDRDGIYAKILLARVQTDNGHASEAEPIARQAVDRSQRLFGADSIRSLEARWTLGQVLREQGRCQEAMDVWRPNTAAVARVLGPVHFETMRARMSLAEAYADMGQSMKFASLLKDEAAALQRERGADDTWSIRLLGMAARARCRSGDLIGAAEEFEDLLTRLNPRDDGAGTSSLRQLLRGNYLSMFYYAKEHQSVISPMAEGVERTRRADPPNYERLWHQLLGLGQLHAKAKQHEKAVSCYREAFETRAKLPGIKFGAGYINLAWEWLATSVAAMGNRDEDIAFIAEQLNRAEHDMVDNPRELAFYYNSASFPLRKGGRHLDKVVEWGGRAHELFAQKFGEDDPITLRSGADTHARALFAAGRTTEGEKLMRDTLARLEKCCPGDRNLPWFQAAHAEMLLALGQRDEAMPMLTSACEQLVKLGDDDRSDIAEKVEILAKQLEASGDPAAAARWRSRVNEGARTKCR